MLLIDLDDTLFEVASIDPAIVAPAIQLLEEQAIALFGKEKTAQIIADSWKYPFHSVAEKYAIPLDLQNAFFQAMETLDFSNLQIQVFPDYTFLRAIQQPKILVTTGFSNLQQAKVDVLGIRDDFEAVRIDESKERKANGKLELFSDILQIKQLNPTDCWVIGDNPDSELKAGHTLGMPTIQRLKRGVEPATFVTFVIESFEELSNIL